MKRVTSDSGLLECLLDEGYDFFSGVPDSGLRTFISDVAQLPPEQHVPATWEAEAVGKVLREWTEEVLLADRGRESEGALVTDERLHGKHRNREGRCERATRHQQHEQRRAHPASARDLGEALDHERPCREQHRKGGTEVVGLAVLHGQDHEGGDEHDTQGAEPPSGPPEK